MGRAWVGWSVVGALGCNPLFGVDELAFDDASATGTGGAATSGSSTSATGGGGDPGMGGGGALSAGGGGTSSTSAGGEGGDDDCGNGILEGGEECDDGNTNDDDGCSDCADDEGFDCVGSPSVCNHAGVVTFENTADVDLEDDYYNGTETFMQCSDVTVAGLGIVDKVVVRVAIEHGRVGDLVIKLVSAQSTDVFLASRPGYAEPVNNGADGRGEHTGLTGGAPIELDDAATVSSELMGDGLGTSEEVCDDGGPCEFVPYPGACPGGALSSLAGEIADGTWKLCVGDANPIADGQIKSVKLKLTPPTD